MADAILAWVPRQFRNEKDLAESVELELSIEEKVDDELSSDELSLSDIESIEAAKPLWVASMSAIFLFLKHTDFQT